MTASYCYPDSAVWAPPTEPPIVVPVDPDNPTEEEAAALALHEAWVVNVADAEAMAWLTLQTRSAGRIAVCPVTVRPCRKSCNAGAYLQYGPPFAPIMVDGGWINVWCSDHRGEDCACTTVREVILPGNVARVTEVKIDDVIIPDTAYYVRNGNRLVRTDGENWPRCQDMNLKDGEGTFFVTYLQGVEPDQLVNRAAGMLADQWYLSIIGDGSCKLPKGTRTVTRLGVTYEIIHNLFISGTGIPFVEQVLQSINPNGLRRPGRVWSPDQKQATVPTSGRW